MQAFRAHTGTVLPLDRANVDTDAIIPKQYLKSVTRSGFGPFLFDDWRYLDAGDLSVDPKSRRPNPEFVLNRPAHLGASVLLARENFGCGSSREHAVWAITDAGFRCVIAPSYADIFQNNCFKNGVPAVALPAADIDALFEAVSVQPNLQVTLDLETQEVTWAGHRCAFAVDAYRRESLLQGLDEIGRTLRHAAAISDYERRRAASVPWLFPEGMQ